MNRDFNERLATYIENNNTKAANMLVMQELGSIIVRHKQDFVDLLNECGIPANITMQDAELVDLYVKALVNQKLLLGTAFLVNMHNKTMGADGEQEVSDEGVKSTYDFLCCNFIGDDYSNAEGVPADPVTAIAAGVGELSKLGSKLSEGSQKKKYGTQDLLAKKMEAKNQLTQSIIAQKQAQLEAANKENEQKQKTQRTFLIVGGVVLGLAVLVGVIYAVKKKK